MAAEPGHRVVDEPADQVVLHVLEGEARVEVDVMEDQLAQPQERQGARLDLQAASHLDPVGGQRPRQRLQPGC
jgi:hypothetical protein